MLDTYRRERGYLYTGATILNMPWVFAYMSDSQPLEYQHVQDNLELIDAIQEHASDARIENGQIVHRKDSGGHQSFLNLDLCFIQHRASRQADDGVLAESMRMVVTTGGHGQSHEIYAKTIHFDHSYFRNLLRMPADHPKRRLDLVALARNKVGGLLAG